MSDQERPRPQYGEYATPEEQRARMGGGMPGAPGAPAGAAPVGPAAPGAPVTARATTVAARPTRRADVIITIALLVYGLTNVIGAVPQLLDFTGFVETWMRMASIPGEFTNTADGVLWGRIGAIVFAAGWVLTALVSWRSLAAQRLSWWIPLLGAIVTSLAVAFCLSVPLLGDPAIISHFSR